jgi:hypothetical protein
VRFTSAMVPYDRVFVFRLGGVPVELYPSIHEGKMEIGWRGPVIGPLLSSVSLSLTSDGLVVSVVAQNDEAETPVLECSESAAAGCNVSWQR